MNENFVPLFINEDDKNIPVQMDFEDRESVMVTLEHVKVIYNLINQYKEDYPAMVTVTDDLLLKLEQLINNAEDDL